MTYAEVPLDISVHHELQRVPWVVQGEKAVNHGMLENLAKH